MFHINAVDTVTHGKRLAVCGDDQRTAYHAGARSNSASVPVRILGFYCDNGSEFINQNVAGMLEKLLIEFTKNRAYRTTDNALVEGKNGATVRKHIGYGFIASDQADAIQRFYTAHFKPYLNFHRPLWLRCAQSGHGRTHRVYAADDNRTPFEKLSSLPCWLARVNTRLAGEGDQRPPLPSGPIPRY